MTRKLRSRTGRGLSTALVGEIVVLVLCVLYLGTRSARLLVLGFLIAGLIGFASVVSMWRGQDEFGPLHRRWARRGTYLFLVSSLFFLLALFSFSTFTSATTGPGFPGENETASPTTPHRFKDLAPPLILLGIALIAETMSGAHFLWELAGASMRRFVVAYGASGAALSIVVFAVGIREIGLLRATYGEQVASVELAKFYFDQFLLAVLPWFVIGLGLTRMAAAFLVRRAAEKVAQAEADADALPSAQQPSA